MTEEIYFNDSSLSIVEEWMGGIQSGHELDSEETSKESFEIINSKAGLGSKNVLSNVAHVDALAVRLAKNAKKRKKSEPKGILEADVDFHGSIEDEFEDSKVAAASSFRPKKNSKGADRVFQSVVAEPVSVPAVETADKPTESEQDELRTKRKRPKTRSKQKNIRRDNRPVSNKPVHLQLGSKEYRGRPLTEVSHYE